MRNFTPAMTQEFNSRVLEAAVSRLSLLPGVGRKTALRLALHLLRRDKSEGIALGESLIDLCNNIHYCRECHNISETDLCEICASPRRDASTLCVVENVSDVMSIERTSQYQGLYHVLGGVISPMDGIGPEVLQIESLVERVARSGIKEVILALGATIEGDTTNFYIYRRLSTFPDIKITQLARGVAVGNELEYTDEITLGRSLLQRTLFSDSFSTNF